MTARSNQKTVQSSQAIGTGKRIQVITGPKIKKNQEEMEKTENREAREDRVAEKNSLSAHLATQASQKGSITLLLSSRLPLSYG